MFTYTVNTENSTVYVPGVVNDFDVESETVVEDGRSFKRCTYPTGLVLEYESTEEGQMTIRSNRRLLRTEEGYYIACEI